MRSYLWCLNHSTFPENIPDSDRFLLGSEPTLQAIVQGPWALQQQMCSESRSLVGPLVTGIFIHHPQNLMINKEVTNVRFILSFERELSSLLEVSL